jgi:hypothetical protein
MSFVIRVFLLLLLISQLASVSVAQNHPILGKFSISENNGDVYLSWSIIAGSSCNGIQIYRSIDSINFSQIGNIPGVCGSVDFIQPFDFTDNDPVKNKVNYYRLELGNQDFSQIVSIEIIDISSNGYQIRPQPATDEVTIYFNNETKQEQYFKLYNLNGIEVFTARTKENFIQFNTAFLQSGLFLFTISVSESQSNVKGKLLVQH